MNPGLVKVSTALFLCKVANTGCAVYPALIAIAAALKSRIPSALMISESWRNTARKADAKPVPVREFNAI